MLGYVEGYDVGLKQVFGFNVSYSIDFLLRQSSVDAEWEAAGLVIGS